MAPSNLRGVLGEIAELYRALWPALKPAELDAMELWQIAVLLGLDERPQFKLPQSRIPIPQPEGDGEVASRPRLRMVL